MPPLAVPEPPLYQQIAARIRQQIAGGVLKPGDELPTIAQLMADYECSAEPVRRALRELDHDGVIVTRQGRRAIVARP
jgi:DNA-binding GntR family transcriptional regulator